MKKASLFICLFVLLLNSNAQPFPISDSVEVSLITCSPGKEVYARFGHTAIRVNDPINDIDIVFNYGIFDFNSDNFYLKFIKGETDYKLAVYDFKYFLPEYIERNSWVWEQVLDLSIAEKKSLVNLLIENYQPENRTYRYNFVFDNCATRPRDKIIESISGRVIYNHPDSEKTFRDWVEVYVGSNTWLKFGIDMIFGDDADIIATKDQSMFLPDVLMEEFQMATIVSLHENNETHPLISKYNVLVEKEPEDVKQLFILFRPLPVTIFMLVLGLLFMYKNRKYHYFYKIMDTILFVAIGLIGCIAVYLSFFSLHPLVRHNIDILWLNPLFLIAGITQWFKRLRLPTLFIFALLNILILIVLLLYAFNVHYFNIAFIPLIVLLYIRSLNYIRIRVKKGIKIGNKKIKYSSSRLKR